MGKEEIYREAFGEFTELAGNLEKLGLENRQEPGEVGERPTGREHVTETPAIARKNLLTAPHLGAFPSRSSVPEGRD